MMRIQRNQFSQSNTRTQSNFQFNFFYKRSLINVVENLLKNLFDRLYPDCLDYFVDEIDCFDSIQEFQANIADSRYAFDDYFVGNLKNFDDLIKLKLSYQIESDCHDLDEHHRKFGYIQAHLRYLIRNTSNLLQQLTDNFLNFISPIHHDANKALAELEQFAQSNPKISNLLECCQKEIIGCPIDQWCLSFNGGKDCTVLLHTLATVYKTLKKSHRIQPITVLLIKTSEMFKDQEIFIRRAQAYYGFKLKVYAGDDLKSALEKVHSNETIKFIFMGCRRTDFSPTIASKLKVKQKTDKDWPEFIRINPLLDWTFKDIWNFIRNLNVPYCSLYDYGFTSIDRPNNTSPNPSLVIENSINSFNELIEHSSTPDNRLYLPGYLLERDDLERCCREILP